MEERIQFGGNRLNRGCVVYLADPLPTTMLCPIVASHYLWWLQSPPTLQALGCIIGMSGSIRRGYAIVPEASTASGIDHG